MVLRTFEDLRDTTIPATQRFCMQTFDDQVFNYGPWIEDYLHQVNPTFDKAKFNKKQDCEIEYHDGQPFESRITYTVGRCASDRTKSEACPEYQTSGQILRVRSARFPRFYIELRMEVLKQRFEGFYPYLFQIQYKRDPHNPVPAMLLPSQVHTSTRPLKLVVKCMKLETPSEEFKRELVWWTTHFALHMRSTMCVRAPNAIPGKDVKSRASGKRTNDAIVEREEKMSRNVRRKTAADVPTLDLGAPSDVEAPEPPPSQTTGATVPVAGSPRPAAHQVYSPSTMVAMPPTLGDRAAQVAAQMMANILSQLDVPMGIIPCVNLTRENFARCMPELFQQYAHPLSLQIVVPHQAPQQMNQTDNTVLEQIEQPHASPEVHLPLHSPGHHQAGQPASDPYMVTF